MAFTAGERKRAEELMARYPHAKSALLPLLHMAQERDGWVTSQAMEDISELLGVTPTIVLGTCSFYTMFKREPVGRLIVSVCTNLACLVNGERISSASCSCATRTTTTCSSRRSSASRTATVHPRCR